VQVFLDHIFAKVDDFIDVAGFHFQGGTDRHEDAASLLAEHIDIPVFHGMGPDVAENTGPDYGLDFLPELGDFGLGLVVITVHRAV